MGKYRRRSPPIYVPLYYILNMVGIFGIRGTDCFLIYTDISLLIAVGTPTERNKGVHYTYRN